MNYLVEIGWKIINKYVFNNIFVKYGCFELNDFNVNIKLRNIMSMSAHNDRKDNYQHMPVQGISDANE